MIRPRPACKNSPYMLKQHEWRCATDRLAEQAADPVLFYCVFCLDMVGPRDMEQRR